MAARGADDDENGHSPDGDALGWAALLASCTEYARAAKALPPGAHGERWRAAVPHVIALQALTHALGEIARVPLADRPFARDRAAVQIRAAAAALSAHWHGEPMPPPLLDLVEGAERAWRASAYAGLAELIWQGPGEWVMPEVEGPGGPETPGGTLLLMAPGTIALPGEPVAVCAGRSAPNLPGCTLVAAAQLAQLYRSFDATGRWVGTFRQAVDDELPAGMPMLVPMWVQGVRVGAMHRPANEWLALQRAAGIGLRPPGAPETLATPEPAPEPF